MKRSPLILGNSCILNISQPLFKLQVQLGTAFLLIAIFRQYIYGSRLVKKTLQGQNQSGGGGSGGDKKDDKDKKKKYEPPIPTRVGKKKRRTKGPDAATKLPQGKIFFTYIFQFVKYSNCM